MTAGKLHPDLSTADVILSWRTPSTCGFYSILCSIHITYSLSILRALKHSEINRGVYPWTAHFSDDLPSFVEYGESLTLWRVSTGQTATQRRKQQVLEKYKHEYKLWNRPWDFDLSVDCRCVFCHLGKSSFITVFDHANKVCRSRCDKFCPECPHDRVQQESTMEKWMNIANSNINAAVVNSVLDFYIFWRCMAMQKSQPQS